MQFVTRVTKCIGWRSEYTPAWRCRVSQTQWRWMAKCSRHAAQRPRTRSHQSSYDTKMVWQGHNCVWFLCTTTEKSSNWNCKYSNQKTHLCVNYRWLIISHDSKSWYRFQRVSLSVLMGRVAKLKLQYFGHITWGSAGQLALTVLEGIMEGLQH